MGGFRRAGRGRWRNARAPRVLLGAAVLAAGLAVAGCSSVRNDLGTSSSECYVDLAAAKAAVHGTGHLQGVRLVSASTLRSAGLDGLYDAVESARPKTSKVCLVAYTGTFRADRVDHPLGRSKGHVAVVAVSYPGKRAIATLIVRRSSFAFPHTHVGLAAGRTPAPRSAVAAPAPAAGAQAWAMRG